VTRFADHPCLALRYSGLVSGNEIDQNVLPRSRAVFSHPHVLAPTISPTSRLSRRNHAPDPTSMTAASEMRRPRDYPKSATGPWVSRSPRTSPSPLSSTAGVSGSSPAPAFLVPTSSEYTLGHDGYGINHLTWFNRRSIRCVPRAWLGRSTHQEDLVWYRSSRTGHLLVPM
jgi:hypothetical protein